MQGCVTFLLSTLTVPSVSVPETSEHGSSCWMAILVTCSSSPWTHLDFHNLQTWFVTTNPTAFTIQEVVLFGLGVFLGAWEFFSYQLPTLSNGFIYRKAQWAITAYTLYSHHLLHKHFVAHRTWSIPFPGWQVLPYQISIPRTKVIPIAPLLPFSESFQVYNIKDEQMPWKLSVAKHWFQSLHSQLLTPDILFWLHWTGEQLQLPNYVIPTCSVKMMLANQLNPVAEFLMQQVLGHKHAFPQNYFLFSPALHISLQSCSTTTRKNPYAQTEQQCRFQTCSCTSGHITRPRRGYIRASTGNTSNTTRCETAQLCI